MTQRECKILHAEASCTHSSSLLYDHLTGLLLLCNEAPDIETVMRYDAQKAPEVIHVAKMIRFSALIGCIA